MHFELLSSFIEIHTESGYFYHKFWDKIFFKGPSAQADQKLRGLKVSSFTTGYKHLLLSILTTEIEGHNLKEIVLNHRMDFCIVVIRITFLSQTTTGILGNFFLMFYYAVLYYRAYTLKPIDLILLNLMSANAIIILSSGVPHTLAAFGLKQFVSDFGCWFLLYIQSFGRSVSIGTICLLSIFQAVTIRSRESCWKNNKVKIINHIGHFISLLWLFTC